MLLIFNKNSAKISVSLLVAMAITGSSHASSSSHNHNIGGNRDSHGCLPAAGYTWCAPLKECIRTWETHCPSGTPPGGDRDSHGCIPSAGYSWCAPLNECIRSWETNCPSGTSSKSAEVYLPSVGGDRDSHGCIPSAGYSWCEDLQKCVQVSEPCPVTNGETFEGPMSIYCDSDMACSLNDECIIKMGSYTIGGPYITGLNDSLALPDGCVANCTGCSAQEPFLEDNTMVGGDKDEHGCLPAAGQTWCPEQKKCIQPFQDNCPVKDGEEFEGPITIDCSSEMRCSVVTEDCLIDYEGYQIGGLYIFGINGTLGLPDGCVVSCVGCTEEMLIGGDKDEHGCLPAAGQTWCPELQRCIQPFQDECPVENGEEFEGPTSIDCSTEMRCSVLTEDCLIDYEGYQIGGPYMDGINGTLGLPDGCVVTCVGCTEEALIGGDKDEDGCLVGAGEAWCAELEKCVPPGDDCPVDGEKFVGPVSLECDDGNCSVNRGCSIDMGTYTIGGPYLSGLSGTVSLPRHCKAECTGCKKKNSKRGLLRGGSNGWF